MSDFKPLSILFQDERFIAVDKPAGLLAIPGRNLLEPSLLRILEAKFPDEKIWVVHRIDRETSGVILFAKNESSHRLANEWFSSHAVKKEYLALASGSPGAPALRVNRPIEGKASLSQVQVVERFTDAFLARVRIATGRRHQIRIHLQAEEFPILGDLKYGGALTLHGISFPRVALHAEKLVLPDRGTAIIAPRPPDFLEWIARLREAGNEA